MSDYTLANLVTISHLDLPDLLKLLGHSAAQVLRVNRIGCMHGDTRALEKLSNLNPEHVIIPPSYISDEFKERYAAPSPVAGLARNTVRVALKHEPTIQELYENIVRAILKHRQKNTSASLKAKVEAELAFSRALLLLPLNQQTQMNALYRESISCMLEFMKQGDTINQKVRLFGCKFQYLLNELKLKTSSTQPVIQQPVKHQPPAFFPVGTPTPRQLPRPPRPPVVASFQR